MLLVYHVLIDFKCSHIDYEVIIVEDNSPDGTLDVANQLKSIFGENRIKILSRPGKMGLGSAYIDGLKLCCGDFVFLMDADMSHHPQHIPQFIRFEFNIFSFKKMSVVYIWWMLSKQQETNCDIVTGTRYAQGGGVRYHSNYDFNSYYLCWILIYWVSLIFTFSFSFKQFLSLSLLISFMAIEIC